MSLAIAEKKFVSILDKIGEDFVKGLDEIEKYLPAAATLASLIFPADVAAITGVVNTTQLIQSSVASVQQKLAAAGTGTATGTTLAADVLTIVTPVVTQLLTEAGVKNVNSTYIQKIVTAVVSILNVQQMPAVAVAA
jgi:hypothetical protein